MPKEAKISQSMSLMPSRKIIQKKKAEKWHELPVHPWVLQKLRGAKQEDWQKFGTVDASQLARLYDYMKLWIFKACLGK